MLLIQTASLIHWNKKVKSSRFTAVSVEVCVHLRRSVFVWKEKESEVCVSVEPDPQVTGASSSSQSGRFPHPPISSLWFSHTPCPVSDTQGLELSSGALTHTFTCPSLCFLSPENLLILSPSCVGLKTDTRAFISRPFV